MINVIISEGNPPVPVWIDVPNPTTEELYGLAENYQLHPVLVNDCLDPLHLPKHERYENTTFMIIRFYDERCDHRQDNVQAMTRKLALFLGDRFLISIHRQETLLFQPIIDAHKKSKDPLYLQVLMLEMLMAAVETYHKPLEEMETTIHRFEVSVLNRPRGGMSESWEEIFRTKCRLTVIKRILWHSMNTVQKFVPNSQANLPLRQDLQERIENLQFFADALLDDLNNLLHIQLSLVTHSSTEAANRTNEVMKVLTLFSAFFLPLNFIVGVYGMNFQNMPELRFHYGYFAVWGVLIGTVTTIYLWFVKKGWIRWGHLS